MAARGFVLVVLLAEGCCGPVRGLYPPSVETQRREVYVRNDDWHTGFVLRPETLPLEYQALFRDFALDQWVEIGWGNDTYYRAAKTNSGLMLYTAFVPGDGVLRVAPVRPDPLTHYADGKTDLYRIEVSEAGLKRFAAFIAASFRTRAGGAPERVQDDAKSGGGFYRATGVYHLLHTCNNWTADGLRATGFPISPAYAAAAGNVRLQVLSGVRGKQDDVVILRRGQVVSDAPAGIR